MWRCCSSRIARPRPPRSGFFFFNDTATTEIYTLSLHDALPIYAPEERNRATYKNFAALLADQGFIVYAPQNPYIFEERSEEHTSELQSQSNLVCRLLLEKKKKAAS